MGESEPFYTVAELSEICGKSRQAIHQRLKSDGLTEQCETQGSGHPMLVPASVAKELFLAYGVLDEDGNVVDRNSDQDQAPIDTDDGHDEAAPSSDGDKGAQTSNLPRSRSDRDGAALAVAMTAMAEQLSAKDRQLEEKDRQLAAKDGQLEAAMGQVAELTRQIEAQTKVIDTTLQATVLGLRTTGQAQMLHAASTGVAGEADGIEEHPHGRHTADGTVGEAAVEESNDDDSDGNVGRVGFFRRVKLARQGAKKAWDESKGRQ